MQGLGFALVGALNRLTKTGPFKRPPPVVKTDVLLEDHGYPLIEVRHDPPRDPGHRGGF